VLLAVTPDDEPFLRDVLVEAAFPEGAPRPTDPLADDHVLRYVDGWGRPADLGVVAWDGDRPVGAAWTRLLPPERAGYGFVAPDVPELTVGVVPGRRGRGLGRTLVAGALDVAAAHGHARVSLSVADEVNPRAAHLYRALGFSAVGRDEGGSLTMVADAAPITPDADAGSADRGARPATLADGPALARLREVMMASEGRGGQPTWVAPLLRRWAEGAAAGRLVAAVVDDDRGRPVASAVAELGSMLPGPGQEEGRHAWISSVATEPGWRRRGSARACMVLLLDLVASWEVPLVRLAASPMGADLYAELGFVPTGHPVLRLDG
jgi:GNAT superfamily N-acetyltransferase